MESLQGQVAVVTGGGRGLGRAFAVALAHEGVRVAVVARSQPELTETVHLVERTGGVASSYIADVTDYEATARVLSAIKDLWGPVDLLVNNAGVTGPIGPAGEADPREWWRCIEVNLGGPVLWTQAVLPQMTQNRRGRIINVASGAGTVGIPYMSGYVTSKSALIRFTEVLAQEVVLDGIRVFAIEPGTVKTAMAMYALESPAGRRWIPWYRNIFEEKLDVLPEYAAELVVRIARGDLDALTGRYIARDDDLDTILRQVDKAIENEWGVLRVRGR